MRALLFNRILIALSFAGLFIAGSLSLAKVMNVSLPCGPGNGCDTVNSHPSAYWAGVPVAYFGFAGYLLLLALSMLQSLRGVGGDRTLVKIGTVVSGIGALVSIGLQIYSKMVIGVICAYCFASAIVMVLSLLSYLLLAKEWPEEAQPSDGKSSMALAPILGAAVVFALGYQAVTLGSKGSSISVVPKERLEQAQIVPPNANIFGAENAKITIVEFADLCCPTCQLASPQVKDFVRQHKDKVRMVYRHFPLDMHPNAGVASAVAEYAAEKGKFWEYITDLMSLRKQEIEIDEIMNTARLHNLDVGDLERRLQNDNDPIYERITRDKNAANALGITGTPTFYIVFPSGDARAYTTKSLMETLNGPEVQQILNGS